MFPVATPDPKRLPRTSLSTVGVEHIRIDSIKSYADTRATLERLPHFDDRIRILLQHGDIDKVRSALQEIQGDAGLVIFSIATHGDWLQIISSKRNVVQYVIGNVLVSTQMTQHELAAALYAPLRIVVYENESGATTIEYDRPSALFGQFDNKRVTSVARDLDQKIHDVLIRAAT